MRAAQREEVGLEGVAHPAPVLQHVVRDAHDAAQHAVPRQQRAVGAHGLLQDDVAVVEGLQPTITLYICRPGTYSTHGAATWLGALTCFTCIAP